MLARIAFKKALAPQARAFAAMWPPIRGTKIVQSPEEVKTNLRD
jgi:hypothetical protein